MEQQGTSTPGGATAADPAPVKSTESKKPEKPGKRCCFGDERDPSRGVAADPQAQAVQRPGGAGAPATGGAG